MTKLNATIYFRRSDCGVCLHYISYSGSDIISQHTTVSFTADQVNNIVSHKKDQRYYSLIPVANCQQIFTILSSLDLARNLNGRHPRLYYQAVAPTTRSKPSELQKLHRNSAAGLPKKMSQLKRIDIMVRLAWL